MRVNSNPWSGALPQDTPSKQRVTAASFSVESGLLTQRNRKDSDCHRRRVVGVVVRGLGGGVDE